MLAVLRRSTIEGMAVPVLCGSAFKNKGVQRLLDSIVAFLPSPVEVGSVKGINPKNDEEDSVSRTQQNHWLPLHLK